VKNAWDYAGGAGLKLVPDGYFNPHSLLNLLYWVFGGDSYIKVAMNNGMLLPDPTWAYPTDDGLGNSLPLARRP
jgi:hypothetical protein